MVLDINFQIAQSHFHDEERSDPIHRQCNAGGLRLDYAQQRTGRDRSVGGGTAGTQHVDCRKCRHGMRRRHHRVLGVHRRSSGEMKISHAKLLTLMTLSAFLTGLDGTRTGQ